MLFFVHVFNGEKNLSIQHSTFFSIWLKRAWKCITLRFFSLIKKIQKKNTVIYRHSWILKFLKIKFLFSEINDIIHVLRYVLEFWLDFCFQELKNQILLEANPLQNTSNENENCHKSVYWQIKCIIYNIWIIKIDFWNRFLFNKQT